MTEPPKKGHRTTAGEQEEKKKQRPSLQKTVSGSGRREMINPCKSLDLDASDTPWNFSDQKKGAAGGRKTPRSSRSSPNSRGAAARHSVVLAKESTVSTRKRSKIIFFLNALVFLVVNVVVLVQHLIDDSGTSDRWQLTFLLLAALVLSLIPGCIIFRVNDVEIAARQLIRPDTGALLIIGAFYSILLQLTIRLGMAKDSFGGDGFANFDFGVKCSSLNETETGTCRNLAFTNDPESWGHFLQGCLAVFLYPATQIIIHQRCRCKGKPGVLDAMIVWSETLAVAVVVYPVYNLIKRILKNSIPFAASSYSNNMAEWAWGFLIGHHLGWCLEVMSGYFGLFHEWYSERSNPKFSNEEERRIRNGMLFLLQKARICAGVLLLISSIVAAIMYGRSWDRRLDKIPANVSSDEIHDDDDALASLGLLLVPMLIAFVFGGVWYGCHRRRLRLSRLGEDNTVGERNLFKVARPTKGLVSLHEIQKDMAEPASGEGVTVNVSAREEMTMGSKAGAQGAGGKGGGLQKKTSRPRLNSESEVAV
jgi:hypothetical protein